MTEHPSILIILPYFGPLPNYAGLFFRSCGENPSINWLLITDQGLETNRLPANVMVKRTTFPTFKKSIDDIMGFETVLTPMKLSDFKAAYGVICSEDAARFAFWGHCDMDVIFGDIRAFLTDEILQHHNKVLIHGHLSLYRNCAEANHYFTLEAPGVSFRDVFASPERRNFDEFGGLRILLNYHKIPFYRNDNYLADINRNSYKLSTIQPPNYRHQCFYWERGRIFKAFWDGRRPGTQEYMYIHLQKRPMRQPSFDAVQGVDAWYITPRGFIPKTSDPSTPAAMDQLNPSNLLFDSQRAVASCLWRVKHMIFQTVDPWPRRA
jgi:hypothetical protein